MNIFLQRRRNGGFTLIELLVVMAIIAILASVVLVGGTQAINAAKRAKTANTATQIQTAIMSYYTEYGTYPIPSTLTTTPQDEVLGTAAASSADPNQTQMIYALCGNVNPYTAVAVTGGTVSNTRSIVFLTPKKNEVDTTGTVVTPFSAGTTYYYYWVAMDGDYSGILGDSGGVAGQMPDFSLWTTGSTPTYLTHGVTQGVAVWACCDPATLKNPMTPTTSTAPAFWVHTY